MRQAGEDYERLVRARDTLLDPLRNVIYLFSGAGGLARMLPVSVPSETRAQCALGAVEVFFFMHPRRIAIFGFVPLARIAGPSERPYKSSWSPASPIAASAGLAASSYEAVVRVHPHQNTPRLNPNIKITFVSILCYCIMLFSFCW